MFADFPEAVSKFHTIYQGPPISLWITGGGFSFLDVLKRPGGSRFIADVVIPYSEESIRNILWDRHIQVTTKFRSCSKEGVKTYAYYLDKGAIGNTTCLAVSAALTSNRYRRGANRAYFCLKMAPTEKLRIFQLNLFHPCKEVFTDYEKTGGYRINVLRKGEDEKVALAMMAILTGNLDAFQVPLNDPFTREFTGDTETVESFEEIT